MNKDFKVGDRVRVVGHPFIKEGTIGKVNNLIEYESGNITLYLKFDLTYGVLEINSKYLEKVEDWLDFKTTNRDIDPLLSVTYKLDKEVKLYNCMYQWKQKFDPEEVDWENSEVDRWYISRYYDGEWCVIRILISKQNLQNLRVYFTTGEKAEQCLEWLKKEGVLY